MPKRRLIDMHHHEALLVCHTRTSKAGAPAISNESKLFSTDACVATHHCTSIVGNLNIIEQNKQFAINIQIRFKINK